MPALAATTLNKKGMGTMKYRIVTLAVILVTCVGAVAQITRQESTRQLKKAVYSIDLSRLSDCDQVVEVWPPSLCYWAVIPMPELTLTNPPYVTMVSINPASQYCAYVPDFWLDRSLVRLKEGAAWIQWKTVDDLGTFLSSTNGMPNTFIIIYEAAAGRSINLSVTNPGTGKSLELNWQTDSQTAQRIQGYKVMRREAQKAATPKP